MKKIIILSSLIALLAAIASATGFFWQGEGQSYPFASLRGETIQIQGHGLYRYDSVNVAPQAIGQDSVTLFIAIPILIISIYLASKGSLRGKIVLTGMLGYFLYTYASMCFGSAYNELFLIYVALFSLSLFTFILSFQTLDLNAIHAGISSSFPRIGVIILCFLSGTFLLLAWAGGRIIMPMINGTVAVGLEHYTSLTIQVLDLGLIVPLAFLTGSLLLQKKTWGSLLAVIFLVKEATLTLAIVMMIVFMIRAGTQVNIIELIVFPTIAIATNYFAVRTILSFGNSQLPATSN